MTAEHLFDAYVNINVTLITVALVWAGSKRILANTQMRSAHGFQLHCLYGLIALGICAPLLMGTFDLARALGTKAGDATLSLSDFLVAQYLHGNIALAPTQFERLLTFRADLTHEIVSLSGWMSFAILGVLAFGFAHRVLRNARDTLYLMRMLRDSYVLRRIGRIDIRFTHQTRVPFSTRGLFRHYIVLPTDLLAQQNDARIAITHELQHVRQGDLSWEVALEILRPFFFWNPAFAYCKRDVERLRELACDQHILERHKHSVRDYCECLLRVCQTGLAQDRPNQIITPCVPFALVDKRANASHSARFLRHRITMLFDGTRGGSNTRLGVVIVLFSVILTLCATLALRPTTDWSHDRLMLSTIVNLERLNLRTSQP